MSEVSTLPLLPLKDMVIFPNMIAPIFIGREKSIKALMEAKKFNDGQFILITAQREKNQDNPSTNELYDIGVLGRIIQTINISNNIKILVEAVERVKFSEIQDVGFFLAKFEIIKDQELNDFQGLKDSVNNLIELFKEYAKDNKKINPEAAAAVQEQNSPAAAANFIASHLSADMEAKQNLLQQRNILERIKTLSTFFTNEALKNQTEQVIQQKVKKQMEKTQRDYFLRTQMDTIKKELESNDEDSDFYDIEKKIKTLKLSKEAKEKADTELKKLKMMNQMSSESSVVRNYLDNLLSMPWGKSDNSKVDISKTEKVLNRDHFGLEKVKERIIEYLSVLQRAKKMKGPILCLIGPPGVGKTSLAKSIAEAVGRKYMKFALGGVRDEAEIRGHRRTYLGSMPGKIITLIKKAKANNPIILLDEIDKMGSDFRGDPASALLEVLDPEQNNHFVDHYLEVEYDLSQVMFIATANSYNLPRALIDRMEIINISGYVEDEKLQIAKKYLVSKQLEMHNMQASELEITDKAILEIIRYYTRESGVRSLEREISSLVRKALTRILKAKGKSLKITITPAELEEYLGTKKYDFGLAETEDFIGSTMGLAYTEVGGDLLTIEAVAFPGKGEVKTTGKLGEVMKESAAAAYSCFRTRASSLGLRYEDYKDQDIHIHFPAGGIPKDGPSAGAAIFTSIVSLMTKKPVKRTVAMTGEITLRGKVLPIGGLREKLLAASRGGIETVLIPQENFKDLKDIPNNIKEHLKIITISNIDQVLEHALVK